MGGASDLPQRSSSPLKRRASSMEPEHDVKLVDTRDDVDMIVVPESQREQSVAPQDPKEQRNNTHQDGAKASGADKEEELPLLNDIPPLDQQIKTIETLVKAFAETPIKEGDQAYLVSRMWLSKAQAFGSEAKHATQESIGTLGPVDNSDIIQAIFTDSTGQQCVKLKPGLTTEHFELFPKDAWDLLVSWYGLAPGQIPIVRYAHNTAPDSVSLPSIQFEFHPPMFTIHRLWSAASPIPINSSIKSKNPPPPVVIQSTSYGYHKFLKLIKELTDISMDRKIRVWRVLQTIPATERNTPEPSGMKTPPESPGRTVEFLTQAPTAPGSWPTLLVDVETFLKLEKGVDRDLVDADDSTTNPNYNGSKSLSIVGLAVDQTLVLDEQIKELGQVYVSTFSPSRDMPLPAKANSSNSSSSLAAHPRANTSSRSSPALPGTQARGRLPQKPGRTMGCVGLQNLGNTCYMNSALQCLRSVEELTKYFLTHEAKKEINPDNPLSHNGDVAMAYSRLLDEIYKDPTPASVAPRHFKSIIGRYAPAFSGYGQQDTQEFLGFLLDGLQEDLNRIKKKPYIEKPDSTDDMINNPAAIKEMADKVWDITKKRDDSVIADLFTGMYKSTLVCPQCDKVSITFDPFNNLTLPLPISNVWTHKVKYYPLNDAPVEINVDMDKNSTIRALKQFISARVGVPVERLFAGEEFQSKFFKFYEDRGIVAEVIQKSDIAVVHELECAPTNAHLVKNTENRQKFRARSPSNDEESANSADDPLAERLLVPVIHRITPSEASSRKRLGGRKASDYVPPPHFIVLNREEARNLDVIRRKILEKLATFTTLPELAGSDDTDTSETTDAEMVNNTSDADSAGDTKIVVKSVEGEEDMVDVTMKDAPTVMDKPGSTPASAASDDYPMLLKQFKKQRPKWLDPREFLEPRLQNLFDLTYFTDGPNTIPTGWEVNNDHDEFPTLASRLPKPPASDVDMRSPGPDRSEESASDESPQATAAITRMADESSDEDDEFSLPKLPMARPSGQSFGNPVSFRGKKKIKPHKTYGKKGKKRSEKQQRSARFYQHQQSPVSRVEPEELPSGALIGVGEGIMVEWTESSLEWVFGSEESSQGARTFVNLPVLDDPTLDAKRKARTERKRRGITLDDCLDEFESEEVLSENDCWYCPRCKEHVRATKKFDLWKTPDILVVHLKRFSSHGWRRDKLDILVDFPIEGLDLTRRVIDQEPGKQYIYDLIAVDNHYGGLGGGHYTAYAKNFFDGQWYEYNDASVSKTHDLSRMVSPAAYLLFYRRRSDIPLGGPKFQEICDKYNSMLMSSNADDDGSDSGEGRRLGQGSSLRGSPSASTGAVPTLPLGNRGLARLAVDPELPSYQASISAAAADIVDDDDTDMGAQLSWSNQETLHNSIEADGEDEGIGMADFDGATAMAGMTSVIGPTWNFDNITPGKHGSDVMGDDDAEIASDVAQGDGSSINNDDDDDDDDSDALNQAEFGDIIPPEPSTKYVEPTEPITPFPTYQEPPPASTNQVPAQLMSNFAVQAWAERNAVHEVPPAAASADDDRASDKVMEIHVASEEEMNTTSTATAPAVVAPAPPSSPAPVASATEDKKTDA